MQPHVIQMDGSLDSVMGLDKQLLLRLLCAAGATENGQQQAAIAFSN